MSNTLRRTLQRTLNRHTSSDTLNRHTSSDTLNRHTSSDTLNRPASTDLGEWSVQVYARVQIYPQILRKTLRYLILFVLCLGCFSCKRDVPGKVQDSASVELLFYCGAGIRPAAEALIDEFESRCSVKVSATYAGSGRLLGQLTTSKRGDLFMPGSEFYVDKAIESGLANKNSKRKVALFIPTILVQKGNPLGVKTLRDFADKQLRIGLGDERAVAIGKRSVKLFEKNKIPYDKVMGNVVLKSGTVNELAVALQLKNVDAVIVWDANARQFAESCDAIVIPEKENIISTIPIVSLMFSDKKAPSLQFIEFVTSEDGKAILKKYGYTIEK